MHVAAAEPARRARGRGRPGGRGARARDLHRAGARNPASPRRSSPRWSRAGCGSSTRRSCSSPQNFVVELGEDRRQGGRQDGRGGCRRADHGDRVHRLPAWRGRREGGDRLRRRGRRGGRQASRQPPTSRSRVTVARPPRSRIVARDQQPTGRRGMTARVRYKRVLLKLSGEALLGDKPFGIDDAVIDRLAGEIARRVRLGVKVGIVIGGGNIFRGMTDRGGRRQPGRRRPDGHARHGDERHRLRSRGSPRAGVKTRLFSAVPMPTICETFTQQRARGGLRRRRGRGLRRRHRQPVLHHRYRRGAAGRRDGLRRALQGRPRSTASIPPTRSGTRTRPATTASRTTRCWQGPRGHGRRGRRPCPRQRYSDNRLLHPRARRFRRRS